MGWRRDPGNQRARDQRARPSLVRRLFGLFGTVALAASGLSIAQVVASGSASASVNPNLVFSKSFSASSIPLNGTTTLTFTITTQETGPNFTGVGFTDALPAGLVVAANPDATNACSLGTFSPTAGSSTVALSGASIPAGFECAYSVDVTATTAGAKTNSVTVDSDQGTGSTATANITVVAPPSISKSFGAASIPVGGTTSLTFTITNPNTTTSLSGVGFTDNLPSGLVVATPNTLTNGCGGTATASPGSGTISLTGGSVASSASCTLSVNVTGTTAGTKNNTTTNVTSTEGGTGGTASASIDVVAPSPPTIAKSFGAASIPVGGTTSLTFTITNPNTTTSLSGVGFTDNLPSGLVVATPNALTNGCGGTATAAAGSGTISLTGGGVASSASCTLSVNVTGTTAGTKNNTTGNVTSTEGGTGGTASASVNVVAPPSISKAFGASTIPVGGTTSLNFTIGNPNGTALTGVGFTDNLPSGLVVATPNGLTNACGGTVMATAGSGTISLSGGTVASSASCGLSVDVTGTTSGTKNNTTGNVTSTEGGTGGTASASVNVVAPPSISKAFGTPSILPNGSTSLTFTIDNPNATTSETGVAFTDNLPSGLVVSTPNALSNTCGGTVAATAGTGTISLTGGAVAPSASCTLSVNVTGTTSGTKNNVVTVSSTNGGTGNTANASVTVLACPAGQATHQLTATTNVGTIIGLFCVNPRTGVGTYTQAPIGSHGTVSGIGVVERFFGLTVIAASGSDVKLGGTIPGLFVETLPVRAIGRFTLS